MAKRKARRSKKKDGGLFSNSWKKDLAKMWKPRKEKKYKAFSL